MSPRLVIFAEFPRRLRRILSSHLKILRRCKVFERPDNLISGIVTIEFFRIFIKSSVIPAVFLSYAYKVAIK